MNPLPKRCACAFGRFCPECFEAYQRRQYQADLAEFVRSFGATPRPSPDPDDPVRLTVIRGGRA